MTIDIIVVIVMIITIKAANKRSSGSPRVGTISIITMLNTTSIIS